MFSTTNIINITSTSSQKQLKFIHIYTRGEILAIYPRRKTGLALFSQLTRKKRGEEKKTKENLLSTCHLSSRYIPRAALLRSSSSSFSRNSARRRHHRFHFGFLVSFILILCLYIHHRLIVPVDEFIYMKHQVLCYIVICRSEFLKSFSL